MANPGDELSWRDRLRRAPRISFLPVGREAGGLLPWVIGVMMYLCSLAIIAAIGLSSGIDRWSAGLAQRLTVQIIHADADERERQQQAALTALRTLPGVADARGLKPDAINALLAPWLGNGDHAAELPVPAMIDLQLSDARSVDPAALEALIKQVAPDARLDDHQRWLSRLRALAAALQVIAAAVVAMVVLCTVSIVIFGTRAGLSTHREPIDIMHLMGAEDQVIAGHFQQHYWRYGLRGALFGTALALATALALTLLADRLGGGLLPAMSLTPIQYLPLIALPPAAAALTMLTARMTVRRALAAMM